MKKITLSVLSLLIGISIGFSQAIPNAGFENWTGSDPDLWGTLNGSFPGFATQATAGGDYNSGSSAIILTTQDLTQFGAGIIPSIAISNGTINTAAQTIDGGFDYTLRPDSIVGYAKYSLPSGVDTGAIAVLFFKWNTTTLSRDTIGSGGALISNGSYMRFAEPITWSTTDMPDTAQIILISSNSQTVSVANAKLYVDDLGFTFRPAPPTVTTDSIKAITGTYAVLYSTIGSGGSAPVTASGVVWGTSANPTVPSTNSTADNATSGSYISHINNLTPNTTYHVRAYATNSVNTSYGQDLSFTTKALITGLPNLNLESWQLNSAGQDSASYWANATAGYGFGYFFVSKATAAADHNGGNTGIILTTLSTVLGTLPGVAVYGIGNNAGVKQTGIKGGMPYSTRNDSLVAFAKYIPAGTDTASIGAVFTKWNTSTNKPDTIGTVQINPTATSITRYAAAITWTVSATPDSVCFILTSSGRTPQATSKLYVDDISLTNTVIPSTLPTVTTTAPSSVTSSGAVSGGTVTNTGNATITDEGIYYDTNPIGAIPAVTATKVSAGVTTTPYTVNLTGLTSNTVYYVVAYATNSVGTAYGSAFSFTTTALPTVTTTTQSAVTSSSATSGGNVTTDGNTPVSARGVVWGTSSGPTLPSTNSTTNGTGTGVFTSNLTSLAASTTYYVRAYATNAVGTSYGNEISFTTSASAGNPATLSTTTLSRVNSTSVRVSGGVTNDGGTNVTARGIVWSTSSGPTLPSVNSTTNGTGTGAFTGTVTALAPSTVYYIRTYATNSNGTTYGNQLVYTTPAAISGCTPDPSITLATPGIFPDAVFVTDTNNLNFSETFTYSLPYSYTNAQGIAVDVDSSFLYDILDKPNGFNVQCGRTSTVPSSNGGPNCIFYPGEVGCFTISGTLPNVNNQMYSFRLRMKDYGIIHVPAPTGDQALQTYFSQGYIGDTVQIYVGDSSAAVGIATLDENKFGIIQSSPNPFSDVVTVKFSTPESGNVDFYVTDLYGREVYRTSVNASTGINSLTYSADDLSSGSYYFTISNVAQRSTKMMILIK